MPPAFSRPPDFRGPPSLDEPPAPSSVRVEDPLPGDASRRTVRLFLFLPWADAVEDARVFVDRLPAADLSTRVADPGDAALVRMARLDCDWHGETARCLSSLRHPRLGFLETRVLGRRGLSGLMGAAAKRPAGEEWWLVFTGQHPALLGELAGRFCQALRQLGVRILLYGFDEVSRTMPGFDRIAPNLGILIHDEWPLPPAARARLAPDCLTIHRSWVANVGPFAAPFVEEPEERILFLGSTLGLTEHRRRQIEHLAKRFQDRFTAIHDHSVPVAARATLARHKVSVCPEGRKFTPAAMSRSHTDRPFWSGCLGMVPVSENSPAGNRLDDLAEAGLLVRYAHGDLAGLTAACEEALAADTGRRRRIYDHYNRFETVGAVIADALAARCA